MAKSFWNRVKNAFKQPEEATDNHIKTNDVNDPTNRQRTNAEDIQDFSAVMPLENIKLQLDLASQTEVLKYLSQLLQSVEPEVDQEAIYGKLLLREKCSTNLGDTVALPHVQATGISRMHLYFLQLKNPITWGTETPVKMVLALFIPQSEANFEHVNYLAGIAQILLKKDVVQNLTTAEAPERIFKIFNK